MVLNFVGDVVLADLFERFRSGIGYQIKTRSLDPFDQCYGLLQQGDINIINLEYVIARQSSRKYPWSEIMRGDVKSLEILKKNRIQAVNLANNHTMDHGSKAFMEMRDLLKSAGIISFGSPRDDFQENPSTMLCEGNRISLLGYYIEESLNEKQRNRIIERILNNIKRIREDKQIIVLSLHWGSEYSDKPYSWMIEACRNFIDSGVDIIYGHHSHTYQGVALYKDRIIAPSLGNFIFEDYFIKNRRSVILRVDYDYGKLRYSTYPVIIGKNGKPVPSELEKKYIDNLNLQLSEIINGRVHDLYSWDKNAKRQVKFGHIKNRMKIRCRILASPLNYIPFIVQ